MKTYQIKNLQDKIAKQEGVIKLIERSMKREGMPAWKSAQLEEKLAKEIRVLNLMVTTLERRAC
jgi:hypothetical protein